jgi:oxalate---CoA ligase
VQIVSDWREWPLTATDGDALALIHLVTEDQVEFKIDTSVAQAAREDLDWNSKRAGRLVLSDLTFAHACLR